MCLEASFGCWHAWASMSEPRSSESSPYPRSRRHAARRPGGDACQNSQTTILKSRCGTRRRTRLAGSPRTRYGERRASPRCCSKPSRTSYRRQAPLARQLPLRWQHAQQQRHKPPRRGRTDCGKGPAWCKPSTSRQLTGSRCQHRHRILRGRNRGRENCCSSAAAGTAASSIPWRALADQPCSQRNTISLSADPRGIAKLLVPLRPHPPQGMCDFRSPAAFRPARGRGLSGVRPVHVGARYSLGAAQHSPNRSSPWRADPRYDPAFTLTGNLPFQLPLDDEYDLASQTGDPGWSRSILSAPAGTTSGSSATSRFLVPRTASRSSIPQSAPSSARRRTPNPRIIFACEEGGAILWANPRTARRQSSPRPAIPVVGLNRGRLSDCRQRGAAASLSHQPHPHAVPGRGRHSRSRAHRHPVP